ncbi:MAG: hypothetical protein RLO21_17005, partial [Nitratireductor sp.]
MFRLDFVAAAWCVVRQASVIAVNRHACPGFLLLFAGQRMGCRLMASETGMTISGTSCGQF